MSEFDLRNFQGHIAGFENVVRDLVPYVCSTEGRGLSPGEVFAVQLASSIVIGTCAACADCYFEYLADATVPVVAAYQRDLGIIDATRHLLGVAHVVDDSEAAEALEVALDFFIFLDLAVADEEASA